MSDVWLFLSHPVSDVLQPLHFQLLQRHRRQILRYSFRQSTRSLYVTLQTLHSQRSASFDVCLFCTAGCLFRRFPLFAVSTLILPFVLFLLSYSFSPWSDDSNEVQCYSHYILSFFRDIFVVKYLDTLLDDPTQLQLQLQPDQTADKCTQSRRVKKINW